MNNPISTARKDYICSRCGVIIRRGERYKRNSSCLNKKTYFYCPECVDILNKLKENRPNYKEFLLKSIEKQPLFLTELVSKFPKKRSKTAILMGIRHAYRQLRKERYPINVFIYNGSGKGHKRGFKPKPFMIFFLEHHSELALQRVYKLCKQHRYHQQFAIPIIRRYPQMNMSGD